MELARQLHVAVGQELAVEDRLHLEHVAQVVGAREAEVAVDLERQVGEGHRLAEVLRHPRRHLVAGEDLAADTEALSGGARPALEDAVGAGADVRHRDAGELGAAEREGEPELAVLAAPRPHAEVDEVVPVERGDQIAWSAPPRRRRSRPPRPWRRSAPPCTCRAASAPGRRRAAIHWRVSSSVDQTTCGAPAWRVARAIAVACAISRSAEKCSQKLVTTKTPCAPAKAAASVSGASASPATTSAPAAASALALVRIGLAGDRPHRVVPVAVRQDRPHQSSTLRPRGSDDSDDLLVGHVRLSLLRSSHLVHVWMTWKILGRPGSCLEGAATGTAGGGQRGPCPVSRAQCAIQDKEIPMIHAFRCPGWSSTALSRRTRSRAAPGRRRQHPGHHPRRRRRRRRRLLLARGDRGGERQLALQRMRRRHRQQRPHPADGAGDDPAHRPPAGVARERGARRTGTGHVDDRRPGRLDPSPAGHGRLRADFPPRAPDVDQRRRRRLRAGPERRRAYRAGPRRRLLELDGERCAAARSPPPVPISSSSASGSPATP